jgi:hypothetical protein
VLAVRLIWKGVEPGWASTNIFNAITFGTTFLLLAVLCQYLVQIRREIQERPLYIVETELLGNVVIHDDGADIATEALSK